MPTPRKDPDKLLHIKGGDWTKEAEEILVSNYGQWKAKHVANKINSRLGTNFTAGAVRKQADVLGIKASTNQGLLTLTEAARQVGTDQANLRKWLRRNKLEMIGNGCYRYLTEDTWQRVQERYKSPPEPCIGTMEAATRLHYHQTTIVYWIRNKMVRGYKWSGRWMIAIEEVERLEREQRGMRLLGEGLERKRR